jgi:hypothetical protein
MNQLCYVVSFFLHYTCIYTLSYCYIYIYIGTLEDRFIEATPEIRAACRVIAYILRLLFREPSETYIDGSMAQSPTRSGLQTSVQTGGFTGSFFAGFSIFPQQNLQIKNMIFLAKKK